LAQDCYVKMPVDTSPTAAFEVIQAKFLFCLSEAVFDRPASEGNPKEFSKRPTVTPGYAVSQEVFRFIGQHVASNDKRALLTDQGFGVCLSPTHMPADLPDLTATVGVLDSIRLGSLLTKRR
jgi:hypothetical protein